MRYQSDDRTMRVYGDDGTLKVAMGALDVKGVHYSTHESPLSPEEKLYGRGLYELPPDWENLSDAKAMWHREMHQSLRDGWPSLPNDQKMSIAYSMFKLSEEIESVALEALAQASRIDG